MLPKILHVGQRLDRWIYVIRDDVVAFRESVKQEVVADTAAGSRQENAHSYEAFSEMNETENGRTVILRPSPAAVICEPQQLGSLPNCG